MKISFILIFFLIFLSFTSCIKEFVPHLDRYNNLLVVEGMITDKPGPYTVKLSTTGSILELSPYQPYSKCKVEILDSDGNQEVLTEVAKGIYQTDSSGIQGVIGRKYRIKISTPGGESYESQEEELQKGIGIQSVYAEQQHRDDPKFFYGRDGYQFYVDTENPYEKNNYYLWVLESTYKFMTDFKIDYYYEGGAIMNFPTPDSFQVGYRTQPIKEIYTLNTAEESQQKGIRVALNYEDTYTKALSIRYSLLVNQYTITKNAYSYWNTIRKMNADQGSLYSQQPYQVKGNIINVSNPQRPALGYFMAAGKAQNRIFVDRLPPGLYRYPTCGLPEPPKLPLVTRLKKAKPKDWPVYIVENFMVGWEIDRKCVDCRAEGFLEKPDFWIE